MLLCLTLDTARTRVQAGGPQEDLLRAEVGLRMAIAYTWRMRFVNRGRRSIILRTASAGVLAA